MGLGFAGEAAHIREVGHLSTADIARATGADESTVRAWLNETRSPSGERAERLVELSALVERLARVIQADYIPVWLRKPNAMLDDEKPIDLVATADYRKVSRVVAALEGTWFRHIPAGGDVHYEPPDPADNRWQRGSVVEGLYFGREEATVWAEWYRFLAEAGVPPMAGLPRDLWRWEVELTVADLSDASRLARVGLPVPKPGRFQWPMFQVVGEHLWRDGWDGLLAPSAARPDHLVLCVFREERVVLGTRPVPPPTLHEFPPPVPQGMTT
ncbi:MAG: RES domain-containing protein [Solirubrobacterales bacterium]|nr:RES domain-containing protein [Solirubrobacterales bacterium]